ncbi:MAG: DUF4091 domain-containing protein [Tannerellaceae bacterium]|nr:DUF4091 domain-containing protein [Tannerellaceae bacterium]
MTDNKPHDSAEVWDKLKQPVQFSWGSTDIRYHKLNVPKMNKQSFWQTKGWKGERVNAQAVIWTNKEIEAPTIRVSDLRSGSAIIPSSAVSLNFVRYVMTDELSKDGTTGCGHRPDPAQWDSSLVADILDILPLPVIEARSTRPVWMNVWIPQDARPGKYKGTLTLSGKNIPDMSLPFEILVLNRTLPAPSDWVFHLDLWQHPYSVARYYEVPLWSEAHFDAMRPIMKRLADAGQKIITTTIMHKPWNGQTYDHFDSMIFRMKKLDGNWEYDYTIFDKWVEFMMYEIGIDKQINCYTLIPWALSFDYYDQATNRIQFVEAKPGDDAYDDYWGSFLKDFAKHLRQKGWFDKTTITMDERGLEAMTAAIKVIRDAEPAFKISSAGYYHEEIQHELYELCLAYGHSFPEDVREERREAGKISTVYTCCSEPYPNTFTFSPPAEAAWIGWHTMAGDYDGYLRWAYNSWTKDPLRDTRFHTWAAGDCYLVYPGNRSSIRFERLIEGIQDFEKIRILKEEFQRKGNQSQLQKLNQIVSQFMPDNFSKEHTEKMIKEARVLLNSY